MNRLKPGFGAVLRRGIKRGYQTVVRERGSKTTLGSLFAILTVTQFLLLLLLLTFSVERTLRQNAVIHLEISATAQDQDIQRLYTSLRSQPFVDSVTFLTRDQAYENEKQNNPQLIAFIEHSGMSNPFPDTLLVRLRDASNTSSLTQMLQDPSWSGIVDAASLSTISDDQQSFGEEMLTVSIGHVVLVTLLTLVAFATLLTLVDLVRRYALSRREEILVERLSGAQEVAIVIPLATEGTILLIISTLLSAGVMVALLALLPTLIPTLLQGLFAPLAQSASDLFPSALPIILGSELLLAPLFATFAAWVGMRPLLSSSRVSLGS